MGLVQDQARKVRKLASRADTAAVAIAIQFSDNSDRDPNAYLRGDVSLLERRPIRNSSNGGWQWPGSGSGVPELRAWRVHWCGSGIRQIFHRESFPQCQSARLTRPMTVDR